MKRYFPIGSVVLLKESSKRVMIIGLKQKQVDSDKVWGVQFHPEGFVSMGDDSFLGIFKHLVEKAAEGK